MDVKRKTRTEHILTLMYILAWIAFIGFMIEAGAIVISFIVSLVNPDAATGVYKGLGEVGLREFYFGHYVSHIFYLILVAVLKSVVWFGVIKTVSKLDVTSPFTMDVSHTLEKISYTLFGIWMVDLIREVHSSWLSAMGGDVQVHDVSGEFLFMAGLMFIISQVFKRGVEIQTENELTV